jgi:hypothetical protein
VSAHPLNAFADHWIVDGDLIRCRHCRGSQQVSWALHDFPHRAECRRKAPELNPWKSLAGLITAQIANAKPVTEPFIEMPTRVVAKGF